MGVSFAKKLGVCFRMKTRESGMPPESMWREFFQPSAMLQLLGLDPSFQNVLEFGCGYGTFTIPAATMIEGSVYAIDIDPEMLAITQAKLDAISLRNVTLIQRDFVTQGTGLPSGSMDYVMLFNILHAEERTAILREAYRVLGEGGKLAIVHWNYDASTPRGPSMPIRPRSGDCRKWAEDVGFVSMSPNEITLPPYHYGWLLQRPARSENESLRIP
jgi:SAM-dependent methyltransferase